MPKRKRNSNSFEQPPRKLGKFSHHFTLNNPRLWRPPIEDQLSGSTCAIFAALSSLSWLHYRDTQEKLSFSVQYVVDHISPLWAIGKEFHGVRIEKLLNFLMKNGVILREHYREYDEKGIIGVRQKLRKDIIFYRVANYYMLDGENYALVNKHIREGRNVVLGSLDAYSSFSNFHGNGIYDKKFEDILKELHLSEKEKKEAAEERGHTVYFSGYGKLDKSHYFQIVNSWGNCYHGGIGYTHAMRKLFTDLYVMEGVTRVTKTTTSPHPVRLRRNSDYRSSTRQCASASGFLELPTNHSNLAVDIYNQLEGTDYILSLVVKGYSQVFQAEVYAPPMNKAKKVVLVRPKYMVRMPNQMKVVFTPLRDSNHAAKLWETYLKQIKKSEGFDIEVYPTDGCCVTQPMFNDTSPVSAVTYHELSDCARMAVDAYNQLEGTDYTVNRVVKAMVYDPIIGENKVLLVRPKAMVKDLIMTPRDYHEDANLLGKYVEQIKETEGFDIDVCISDGDGTIVPMFERYNVREAADCTFYQVLKACEQTVAGRMFFTLRFSTGKTRLY